MKTHPMFLSLAAGAALWLASGCTTQTKYVDSSGPDTVVTAGRINIQDFARAASDMTQSLIDNYVSQGRIKSSVAGEPALMAISRIVNDTSRQFDTDLLIKQIRVDLNRTGKIVTSTTMGLGGAEDPLAQQNQDAEDALKDRPARRPDYTLSGKIIEIYAREKRNLQYSYVFQLSLTDRQGIAVWEEQMDVTKQERKRQFGF